MVPVRVSPEPAWLRRVFLVAISIFIGAAAIYAWYHWPPDDAPASRLILQPEIIRAGPPVLPRWKTCRLSMLIQSTFRCSHTMSERARVPGDHSY